MESRPAPPLPTASEFAAGGARPVGGPAAPSTSGKAPAIVALTDDAGLLEALTLAALERAVVVTSPSVDRFVDQLVANAPQVALIDAACAPAALEDFVALLHRQFPQLLLLIAGPPPLQHQLAAPIADGTVFRFAHKPASAQRLRLFIDAALRRRQGLGEPAPPGPAASEEPTARFRAVGAARRRLPWAAALLFTLGAGGVLAALWRSLHDRSAGHPAPAAPAPTMAAAAPADTVDQAERERLLAESRRREAALLEQVRRSASGARAERAHVYVELARKRLASGALLQPGDDSARAYVQSAVALAPEDSDVRAVARALGDALIAAFRQSIAAGDQSAAESWLQACAEYHITATPQAQLANQLEALQRARGAPVAQDVQDAPAAQDAQDAQDARVSPSAPSATAVVPESDLKRVRFIAPIYPPEALARGLTGSVDLEFTVTSTGEVRDIQVQSAEPPGVFEQAAVSALARCRYPPVQRDGVAVAQRTHLKLRFTP